MIITVAPFVSPVLCIKKSIERPKANFPLKTGAQLNSELTVPHSILNEYSTRQLMKEFNQCSIDLRRHLPSHLAAELRGKLAPETRLKREKQREKRIRPTTYKENK